MDIISICAVLGVYSLVSIPIWYFTFVGLCKRKQWVWPLRLWSAPAYLIHGIVSVHLFHGIRQDPRLAYATYLLASTGIKACMGILLPVWNITLACIVRKRVAKDPGAGNRKNKRKSRGYFYLLIVDAVVLALLAASVALTYRFLPFSFSGCRDTRNNARSRAFFSLIKHATGDEDMVVSCQRILMVQITTVLTIMCMTLQDLHMVRFVCLPAFGKAVVIFSIRALRMILCLDRNPKRLVSVEEKDTPQDKTNNTLASLFRCDDVAARLAGQLHYNDIVNTSLASKTLRNAVFSSSADRQQDQRRQRGGRHQPGELRKGSRNDRVELLAVHSCDAGEKEQCWACGILVCQSCKATENGVEAPRTATHTVECYAICTSCYLWRGSVQPAPLSATLRPGKLALQRPVCPDAHAGRAYYSYDSPRTSDTPPTTLLTVTLCPTCWVLGADQVTATREERETRLLRTGTALRRRLHCANCAKAMSKDRKRWWVYDCGAEIKHIHECQWEGHEIQG
ncbi:hypothetical protein N658DRAFT_528068 [Parathielavia hyrcaniae]|uniref:Uncharacterized protein n=1 Tax=Parathielavia hyrcaniae TaxID=113614 RepID=A0AAN6PQN1_9PEZI|nr:hypothetical protein N658DRAFT_528068 [Parathielavia hyrcaniae]